MKILTNYKGQEKARLFDVDGIAAHEADKALQEKITKRNMTNKFLIFANALLLAVVVCFVLCTVFVFPVIEEYATPHMDNIIEYVLR
jgi:hypothetical protein